MIFVILASFLVLYLLCFYKDNIKHTKITFDFGELLDYYVVSPNDNSTYKKVYLKMFV